MASKTENSMWSRRPTESEEAYRFFITYRDMGINRTLNGAASKSSDNPKASGRARGWSARHSWVERARSWDNHVQAERDAVAVKEARKWEGRRLQALDSTWDIAQLLREKLEKMLAFPVQRQRTEQDGKVIIIEPARWTYQTVAIIAKTIAELQAATLIAVGQDPDSLTDDQARAVVDGADLKVVGGES